MQITVININPGYNRELMEKCESLSGYMAFVKKARSKKASGIRLEEAVRQAVDECISEGILAEFFREHRKEIIEMGIYEFDQELHDKVLLEDGEAIGRKKGMEEGTLQAIKNIMDTLNMTKEQAMAALKVPESEQIKYDERLADN